MWFNLLAEGDNGGGNNAGTIIMLVVLVVAIVGLFVWQSISNKKRQKEAQAKVDALKVGDRVKTIGGICGFVHEINNAENTFVLETGSESTEKCYIRFDKQAIYQTDAVVEEDAKDGKKEGEEKPESSQSESLTDEPAAEQQPAPVEQAEETSSEPAYDDKQ